MATFVSKNRKTDFVTGGDIELYLIPNPSDLSNVKVASGNKTNSTKMHVTQVATSSQNQWSRNFFIGDNKPKLVSSNRSMTSISFSNVLSFIKGSDEEQLANSARFYLAAGKTTGSGKNKSTTYSFIAYIQGFTFTMSQSVQQVPEMGSDTIYTVPVLGAYNYRLQINRLVAKNSGDIETILSLLGQTDPLLTSNVTDTETNAAGKKISATTFATASKTAEPLQLIAVIDGGTSGKVTITYDLGHPVIDAQSISVSGGQFMMEGVGLEIDSIAAPVEANNTSGGSKIWTSNSILYMVSQLLTDTGHTTILPLDFANNNDLAKEKFGILLKILDSKAYIAYRDCYIPTYSLSISANAPELTESFNIVTGGSKFLTTLGSGS